MSSTARVASVFLSTVSVVGLCACGGHSPSSPTTRTSVVAPSLSGTYMLSLQSGAADGCSGGNRPDVLPGGLVFPFLRFELEGAEWVGRLATPETGTFELRLQMRVEQDDRVTTAGTIRGDLKTYPDGPVNAEINQPATIDGHLVNGARTTTFIGTARGEVAYDDPIIGRRTCSSASWMITPANLL